MQRALRPSALVPRGFDVESAFCDGATTVITVRPTSGESLCPGCGAGSRRIHSRYQRRLTDLPLAGRQVRLMVVARRFRCDTVLCSRRIFTERFEDGALVPWARRTARLDLVVHHLGLALGGRPAASFARRLMLPVSNDTLLRVVRRRGCPPFAATERDRHRRLGMATQSAVRNNHLRPRAATTDHPVTRPRASDAEAWLAGQPQIAIVARDRGGGYALAAAKALPHATQVADRWHLMENASHAFLDAVRKSMRQIRVAVGADHHQSQLLTAAERIQYEGYLRREETNAAILRAQVKTGVSIKEIVRLTGHSRGLVRKVLRGQRTDVFRARAEFSGHHSVLA